MLRYFLLASTLLVATAQAAPHEAGKPFAVAGERVDAPLPAGAKLAYMAGDARGEFIAEFASPKEDIAHWESLFVAQQRIHGSLADAVKRTLAGVRNACHMLEQPRVFAPQKGAAKFKGDMLAVTLYCRQAMPHAPHGELMAMLFMQGQQHTFKYWRSWRPQTQQQVQAAQQNSMRFLSESLKDAGLCNPQAGRDCRYPLLPQ